VPGRRLADIAAFTLFRPHPARHRRRTHSASRSLADITGQGSLPRAGQDPVSCQRKVGSSILPLTTTLTCANARLVIVKVES
jgi:hypothetical protein